MHHLKETGFILSGRAYVELRDGFVACVDFEIKPIRGTDRCTGALSVPAEIVNELAKARTVRLVVSRGRAIGITIDDPGVLADVILFTCSNPLTPVDRTAGSAVINIIA